MIRVALPYHLRRLAGVEDDVEIALAPGAPTTIKTILDALESKYPMLRGTIRDHGTLNRRPFLRFFACGKDWSLESPDTPLPDAITTGAETFMVIGAIAGG